MKWAVYAKILSKRFAKESLSRPLCESFFMDSKHSNTRYSEATKFQLLKDLLSDSAFFRRIG
ncbi:hypothetical protein TH62_06430 [Bacillus sp. TH008]|nr:hypothetical protein TH62_06430 [Bacillus sp. TH008]